MGPDPIQELIKEDQQLKVGDSVLARWSRNGFYYKALARVIALRRQRVEVVLEEVPAMGELYRRGQRLELPRISDFISWSSESCVRKLR